MSGKTFAQCRDYLRWVLQIFKRPGGPEALRRHLDAADQETRPLNAPLYCDECGSTDFEPISTQPEHGRERVLKLRCRACGHLNSY